MRSVVALFLLFAVVVVCGAAPLLNANSPTVVNGSYIVVLKTSERSSRDAHVMELRDLIAEQNDASVVRHIYSIGSMLGFSARLSQNMLNQQLNNPNVKYIEADQVVKGSFVTQDEAVWGLARISGVKNTQSTTYYYNSSAGAGVDVYVIDTGIYTKNEDFGSRAKAVFNAIDYENGQDLNGHGTHCAGTIGGTTYGVAKKVSLKGVKVLDKDGSGTIESVVAGVNYVTNERSQSRPTVASMSLGGGASTTIDDAVEESIASGIVYAIAAGNENDDACYSSPARVPSAVTVGATDSKDKRATFSNWGDCVDIFAPGVSIKSDWIGDKVATKTISGTSMATPHVAGVLALHLGENPSLSPKESGDWLRSVASQGLVINPESANYLLFAPSF